MGLRGELCAVISSRNFEAIRLERVGHKVAFAGFKLSGGITGVLYSCCTCVEVRSSLPGVLVQRSSLVPNA